MATVSIEVQAAVEDAVSGLQRVTNQLELADTSIGGLGKNARAAFDVIGQFTGGIQAVAGAVESVIGPTIEYGNQLKDLSAFAGISVEESSKLIQVTDDLGIEFTTLRTAARNMADNGLQPSLRELAKLSDEFNEIQDPVEQSQFLIDQFGARAGPQMAFALRQGSAALLQMGEDAEATGLVVGQDFVDSTEKARLAIDQYEDSIMAAKVALSEHLLPLVTATVTQGADYIAFWSNATAALYEGEIGLLDFQRAGLEVLFTEKTMAEATAELRQETVDYTAALDAANAGQGDYYQRSEDVNVAILTQAERTNELRYNTDLATQAITYATIEELKLKAAAEDAAAAQAELKGKFDDLAMAIDGPVSQANEDYYDQQRDAGAVIADLKIELEKLKAAHGQVVTSTVDGTEAARNLIIAQDAAATAAENLTKAQEKLAEDPGDLGLQAAVARAEIAVANSEANVIKWGETITSVNETYVINNDAAIAEVEARLEDANAAYDANATAHEEATARFVFDLLVTRLGADGEFSLAEQAFLTDVGEAWGIYDTKTADTIRNVDRVLAEHGLNSTAVVDSLGASIAALPTSHTTDIYIRTHYETYGAEPGPGVPPIAPPGPPDDPANANDGAF